MAATLITYSHNVKPIEGCSFEIVRLISGTLELSALYSFKFLIKVRPGDEGLTSCVKAMQQLLGSRIRVDLRAGNSRLQTVLGIIMSIESSTQYGKGEDAGWYVWTIRPELAQSCYSCGRRIFADSQQITKAGDGNDSESSVSLVDVLTAYYRVRWNTDITFDTAVRKRIPDTIQLRQNDESDYNFLTRLLAAWGLGYTWDFSGARESITVYDAVDASLPRSAGDLKSSTASIPSMHPVSSGSSMWKLSFGVQNLLRRSKPLVENYNAVAEQNEGCVSLHDESWDQRLGSSFERDTVGIFRSRNDNGRSCHGAVTVQEEADATNASRLCLGGKVQWATDTAQYSSSDIYYVTRMQFSAANKSWEVIINGRTPDEQSGLGILPKPVHLNNSPDLSEDELICGDSWPEPQPRYFLAVVEDGSIFSNTDEDIVSTLPARNLCKVREIAPQNIKKSDSVQITLENTLWVELGSPFADQDSGLLARPRKGNVLLCLDRGDLSIPLAVSALFRDNNTTPYTKLKTMERHLQTDLEPTTDYSTVTLRNRVHIPKRKYESGLEDPVDSPTLITRTNNGKEETYSLSEKTTRPMSVTELAKSPLPFSQIQLVSRDNGTKPIPHNDAITNTYLSSSIIETVSGTMSDADGGGNYVMANAAKTAQSLLNTPITRPHFEGVNIYSSCDVLLQSADHQIINAGGEIVITADKGITLRVGKSSVKITEAGIEIVSGTGKVINPGAYPASTDKSSAQQTHLMNDAAYPLSGSLVVDSSGVILKGPHIVNTVTNSFKTNTILGSLFSLSDFNAKLYAPQTSIIGGAAVDSSVTSLLPMLMKGIPDIADTSLGRDPVYAGGLQDCGKTTGPNLASFAGSAFASISKVISTALGAANVIGGGMSSLLSITGSMVKLTPSSMSLSAETMNTYFSHLYEICNPVAGYLAMAERMNRTSVLKKGPRCLAVNTSNMADALFIVDVARMSETCQGKNKKKPTREKLSDLRKDYDEKAANYESKRKARQALETHPTTLDALQNAQKAEEEAKSNRDAALEALNSYIASLQDAYTRPEAGLPSLQFSRSTIGGLIGTFFAGGILYVAEQVLLSKILSAGKSLASALYLGKREVLDGIQNLTVISERETALRREASTVAAEERAVDREEASAESRETGLNGQSSRVSTSTQTVNAEQEDASLRHTAANQQQTFVRRQVTGGTENATESIVMYTGPAMHN